MMRSLILAASSSRTVHDAVTKLPLTKGIVARYVAGESLDDAVVVAKQLIADGLSVSLDFLGEHCATVEQAAENVAAYVALSNRLASEKLGSGVELSVKLSSLGVLLDQGMAREFAERICTTAADGGSDITFDMEDHFTTDSTLDTVHSLRQKHPRVGVALQAYLRRTEDDCRQLATTTSSRIRLVKGAYAEPAEVAFQHKHEVDRSFVRCMNILLAAEGYPMIATHDPRLISIAQERARQWGRSKKSYEFQLLYGVRPAEQQRLSAAGESVRVYVPYGIQWYSYLMRRLAERPANVGFFLRSLVSK